MIWERPANVEPVVSSLIGVGSVSVTLGRMSLGRCICCLLAFFRYQIKRDEEYSNQNNRES